MIESYEPGRHGTVDTTLVGRHRVDGPGVRALENRGWAVARPWQVSVVVSLALVALVGFAPQTGVTYVTASPNSAPPGPVSEEPTRAPRLAQDELAPLGRVSVAAPALLVTPEPRETERRVPHALVVQTEKHDPEPRGRERTREHAQSEEKEHPRQRGEPEPTVTPEPEPTSDPEPEPEPTDDPPPPTNDPPKENEELPSCQDPAP